MIYVKCGNKDCDYTITNIKDINTPKCPICGSPMHFTEECMDYIESLGFSWRPKLQAS